MKSLIAALPLVFASVAAAADEVPVIVPMDKDGWFVPHDIVIDAPEAGIKVRELLSRDSKRIDFTPTKVGSYPFYCDKKAPFMESHRKMGMEGVLEVVE